MSKHFAGKTETERKTGLPYLLSPRRPLTPGEARFRVHSGVRAALVLGMALYFVYCNPDYSYTYSALRRRWGWEGTTPIFPQYLAMHWSAATTPPQATDAPEAHSSGHGSISSPPRQPTPPTP